MYEYETSTTGVTITITHHNGIKTPGLKTSWTMDSSHPDYCKWLKTSGFVVTPPVVHMQHTSEPTVKIKSAKAHVPRVYKSQMASVGKYRVVLVTAARDWAATQHAVAKSDVGTLLAKEKDPATCRIRVPTKGWAFKRSLPSVQFPKRVKLYLIECFNKKPHVSPDQALVMLKGRLEFMGNVFIEYFVTPTRIKGYFGRLKKYREDKLAGNEDKDVPASAAGGDPNTGSYKGLTLKADLVAEIKLKGIHVEKLYSMTKAKLVDVLVTNDIEREGLEPGVDAEEEFHMAEAKREDESGGLNNTELSQRVFNVDTGVLDSDGEDSEGDNEDPAELLNELMQE
jgi:hypothetical protein